MERQTSPQGEKEKKRRRCSVREPRGKWPREQVSLTVYKIHSRMHVGIILFGVVSLRCPGRATKRLELGGPSKGIYMYVYSDLCTHNDVSLLIWTLMVWTDICHCPRQACELLP